MTGNYGCLAGPLEAIALALSESFPPYTFTAPFAKVVGFKWVYTVFVGFLSRDFSSSRTVLWKTQKPNSVTPWAPFFPGLFCFAFQLNGSAEEADSLQQ